MKVNKQYWLEWKMTKSILKNNNGKYKIENVSIEDITQEFSTPTYIYSKKVILDNYLSFTKQLEGIDHLICLL